MWRKFIPPVLPQSFVHIWLSFQCVSRSPAAALPCHRSSHPLCWIFPYHNRPSGGGGSPRDVGIRSTGDNHQGFDALFGELFRPGTKLSQPNSICLKRKPHESSPAPTLIILLGTEILNVQASKIPGSCGRITHRLQDRRRAQLLIGSAGTCRRLGYI